MLDKEMVGKMIALQRKRGNMTQKQLADALHVTYQAVSRWELGTSLPSVEMLYDLANVLNTSVDYLLKGEELVERDINYMDSGLNTARLYDIKDRLQELVTEDGRLLRAHYTGPVIYREDAGETQGPVRVAQIYVPGSKLRLAREYGYDREISEDLVASAFNYTCSCGARPMLFQAVILCGDSRGEQLMNIGTALRDCCERENVMFAGLAVACQPINFRADEYELAAFCTGRADREELLSGSRIREGDVLIGIYTKGINGISYPFVRIMLNRKPSLAYADMGGGHYFLDEVMKPTSIYTSDVLTLQEEGLLHDAVLIRNSLVPRRSLGDRIPEGLGICVDLSEIPVQQLYHFIAEQDMISKKFIPHRFHMGIGMIVIVPGDRKERAMELIRRRHECVCMGYVEKCAKRGEEAVRVVGELKW